MSIDSGSGDASLLVLLGSTLAFHLELQLRPDSRYYLGINIRNVRGIVVYSCPSLDANFVLDDSCATETIDVTFSNIDLAPGTYYLGLWLGDAANQLLDRVRNCLSFEIAPPLDKQFRGHGCVVKIPCWQRRSKSD